MLYGIQSLFIPSMCSLWARALTSDPPRALGPLTWLSQAQEGQSVWVCVRGWVGLIGGWLSHDPIPPLAVSPSPHLNFTGCKTHTPGGEVHLSHHTDHLRAVPRIQAHQLRSWAAPRRLGPSFCFVFFPSLSLLTDKQTKKPDWNVISLVGVEWRSVANSIKNTAAALCNFGFPFNQRVATRINYWFLFAPRFSLAGHFWTFKKKKPLKQSSRISQNVPGMKVRLNLTQDLLEILRRH